MSYTQLSNTNNQIYFYADKLKGIERERFIRIFSGNVQKNDRLFLSNLFVKIKFDMKNINKMLNDCQSQIKGIDKKLSISSDKKLEQYKYELYDFKNTLEQQKNDNLFYLKNDLYPLISQYFTKNEIKQLMNDFLFFTMRDGEK